MYVPITHLVFPSPELCPYGSVDPVSCGLCFDSSKDYFGMK